MTPSTRCFNAYLLFTICYRYFGMWLAYQRQHTFSLTCTLLLAYITLQTQSQISRYSEFLACTLQDL